MRQRFGDQGPVALSIVRVAWGSGFTGFRVRASVDCWGSHFFLGVSNEGRCAEFPTGCVSFVSLHVGVRRISRGLGLPCLPLSSLHVGWRYKVRLLSFRWLCLRVVTKLEDSQNKFAQRESVYRPSTPTSPEGKALPELACKPVTPNKTPSLAFVYTQDLRFGH